MFGPEHCIAVRIAPSALDDDGRRALYRAVGEFAEENFAFVRLLLPGGMSASAIAKLVAGARPGGVRGEVSVVLPLVMNRALAVDANGLFVTVLADATTTLADLAAAAEALKNAGAIVEFERVHREAPTGDEILSRTGAWRVIEPGNDPYQTKTDGLEVAADGQLVTRGSAERSALSVSHGGFEAALRDLGLSVADLKLASPLRVPWVMPMPEPGGGGRIGYWDGGTQALAFHFSQEEARAAFGFRSDQYTEYAEWLRGIANATLDDNLFGPWGWGGPRFGPKSEEDADSVTKPKKSERMHPAAVFASWICRGELDVVRSRMALVALPNDESVRMRDDHPAFGAFMTRMAALLAMAIEVVAMSRLPEERRTAAARVLLLIGTHDAKRSAIRLSKLVPVVGEPVCKRFRQRGPMNRLKRGRNPVVLRHHVEEALQALAEAFPAEKEASHAR